MLAETSILAAGFLSPRLPVRRSCMGSLRIEKGKKNPFNIITPAATPETGVARADALKSAVAVLIRATSDSWSADGPVSIASSPMFSLPSCKAP
jgi:hypothetical protein